MKRAGLSYLMRAAAMTLAALALLVKAALPTGFMLEARGAGELTVVLCTVNGAVETAIDDHAAVSHEDQGDTSDDGKAHDAPCAFAALAALAPPPHPAALAAPYAPALAPFSTPQEQRPQLLPAGPPMPARGPPQYA